MVRGVCRVRLLRTPRVRTCQLRLQVGSDSDNVNAVHSKWYAYFSDNLVVSSLGVFSCLLQIAVFI